MTAPAPASGRRQGTCGSGDSHAPMTSSLPAMPCEPTWTIVRTASVPLP